MEVSRGTSGPEGGKRLGKKLSQSQKKRVRHTWRKKSIGFREEGVRGRLSHSRGGEKRLKRADVEGPVKSLATIKMPRIKRRREVKKERALGTKV